MKLHERVIKKLLQKVILVLSLGG